MAADLETVTRFVDEVYSRIATVHDLHRTDDFTQGLREAIDLMRDERDRLITQARP